MIQETLLITFKVNVSLHVLNLIHSCSLTQLDLFVCIAQTLNVRNANLQAPLTVVLSVRNVLLMESLETHSLAQVKYAWSHAQQVNSSSMRL